MSKVSLPSIEQIKDQAKTFRAAQSDKGVNLSHSQALEMISQSIGFKDWNTLRAAADSQQSGFCYKLGQRVEGRYLSTPFAGELVSVNAMDDSQLTRVRIKFDQPIDVVKFDSFSNFRRQVSCSLTKEGVTKEKTSNGLPQMVLLTMDDSVRSS